MYKRTVYPGRSWLVEYGGPETDWPTYLVARIYRVMASMEVALWTVIDAAKVARYARSGNYLEAHTASLSRHSDRTYVATCLVAVDTSCRSKDFLEGSAPLVNATVLMVDGGWEVYHDAQAWELRGLGSLMDSVQATMSRVSEARLKDSHKPVSPASPVKPVLVWYCEQCQTANVNDHDACVACGLKHVFTNLTATPDQAAKMAANAASGTSGATSRYQSALDVWLSKSVCVKCGKPFVAADGALMGVCDRCANPLSPSTTQP